MPLTVTLELSNDELDYFRTVMRRVRLRSGDRAPEETAAAAAGVVARLRSTARSPFITRRLDRVDRMIAMLADPQWALPEVERRRVLDGLAYVADLHDLVPDDVPALGLLDDAIMLELVLRDLQHELDAYEEFAAYRDTETARAGRSVPSAAVSRQDWLDSRREALHARMRERRERDLARHGDGFDLITRF
ncbi:MAG TPA: YkvA family protein [Steroidobacteraceae bacterium]|nr:YkvA family protein [Steroidobacteraceae bacterium]